MGYQTLYASLAVAAWFIAEACQSIIKSEDVLLNQKPIRFMVSESNSRKYRRVTKAMISVMEEGEEGLKR